MTDVLTLAGAFVLALAVTACVTPVAMRLAVRFDLLDRPAGYKQHLKATPYLGGLAVVTGLAVSVAVFASDFPSLGALLLGAAALLAVGTLDDRVGLGPGIRVVVTLAVATLAFWADLGWSIFDDEAANFALTSFFVLAAVNSFNLMDNLDGATGTVAGVGGLGIGTLAAIEGSVELAALCFALAGACAGFLRYNLAKPARIFLGDGGSMPIGLIVATAIMGLPRHTGVDAEMILLAVVLVGLPALDTTLVVVSRLRRGVTVLTGGRDHLTHRLLAKLGSPRRVALALAAGQAALALVAIVLYQLESAFVLAGALGCIVIGIGIIAALEFPRPSGVRGLERAGA